MPLNKSLRDEEKERINAILKKLVELLYVLNFGKAEIDEELKSLGLTTEVLLNSSGTELIEHLGKLNFDWENTEKFADYLVLLSDKMVSEKQNLIEKALLIYNYIQSESKTFSFDIFGKIGVAKGKL
ncbi:hypothetical protein FLAN108750_12035 [Flavobacterium antarcticum]|uniref:hypothetical protein n=1 Tax=Flavobacterium antarcticum TaxID=271155 RepID=UPI0003B6B79F|nr:hypothetical protein [Flavobacterium antarcticum]